jgi:hypothetical protein
LERFEARNPEQRFKEHRSGKTSKFVKENLPIKCIYLKLLDSTDWDTALLEETRQTVELIEKYGLENAYGGDITGDLKRRTIIFFDYINNQINGV